MYQDLNFLYEQAEQEHNYLRSNWEWFVSSQSSAEDEADMVWQRVNQN